jgi:hypothetical protein
MSDRYLLPCDCGKSVAIELSQAGQTVSCSCGKQLAVPAMRLIRQLPIDKVNTATPPAKAEWNPAKGATFALAMLLLLSGIVIAIYTYPTQTAMSKFKPVPELFEKSQKTIDVQTPEELWDLWNAIVSHGIGEHDASPFVYASKEANRLGIILIISIGMIIGGVVLAIVSLLLPGRQPATKPSA